LKLSSLVKYTSLAAIDSLLNIRTTLPYQSCYEELIPFAEFDDMHRYGSAHYLHLYRIMQHIRISPADVFLDLGCGMGRVCCFAGLFPFRKSIGVDIDQRLCKMARENARSLRFRQSEIEIIHDDALRIDFEEPTVFYLFNPFGEQSMRKFLDKVYDSLVLSPRPIQIVYYNPLYKELYEQLPWLAPTHSYTTLVNPHEVSFWHNTSFVCP